MGFISKIKKFFSKHKKSKKIFKSMLDLLGYSKRRRRNFAMSYYKIQIENLKAWSKLRTENYNFYYELTDRNINDLSHLVSVITDKPFSQIQGYMDELKSDLDLRNHISSIFKNDSDMRDAKVGFGRRYGWYAIIRATQPKTVLETGVHQGVGAVLICRALARNTSEGAPGEYIGVDIDPYAGVLLKGEYANYGRLIISDAIKAIDSLDLKVDLFISDSDHNERYEQLEYHHIQNKLSSNAIILADNSHATQALANFSLTANRKYIFFKEEPKDHWYPGAGIGISIKSVSKNWHQ